MNNQSKKWRKTSNKYGVEYKNRFTLRVSDSDKFEIERLAMVWGLDCSDIIRIATKKFLNNPTLDFGLDAEDKTEFLRVEK